VKILYVSPSQFPSTQANAVHVINQCIALSHSNDVTLVCARKCWSVASLGTMLTEIYGKDVDRINLKSFYYPFDRGIVFYLAISAVVLAVFRKNRFKVLSRNLYFSYIFQKLTDNSVYETHNIESGIRAYVQKSLLLNPQTNCIVISQALKNLLCDQYPGVSAKIEVLHDGANLDDIQLSSSVRADILDFLSIKFGVDITKFEGIVGYFGHLYSGRGVDNIILRSASKNPKFLYLLVGGNETDVAYYRSLAPQNMILLGYIPHAKVQNLMMLCDVLLMPYQNQVSIGIKGHETSKWMSPLKMFEYMASRRPIISSDLPVIREVLVDRENALLVAHDREDEWTDAIRELIQDKGLSLKLSARAHKTLRDNYTWKVRAKFIIKILLKQK